MKLYNNNLSPFAGRVRMAIHAKGLDIDIVDPPASGIKGAEYLALNPLGRIPTLVLDDGTAIPESDTIVEYLEDKFPQKPLRPASAEDRARARLIARAADLYVIPHGLGLFAQLNPANRDAAVLEAGLAKVDEGLTHLNVFLGDGPYAVRDTLSTADCCLVPFVFFFGVFSQAFAKPDLIAKHQKLGAYAAFIQTNPVAQSVLAELQGALSARVAAAAGA